VSNLIIIFYIVLESYINVSVSALFHIFTLAVLLSVIYIYRNCHFGY